AAPDVGDYSWATASGRTSFPMWADTRGGSPDAYTVRVGDGITTACQNDTSGTPGANVVLSWRANNVSPFADTLSYTVTDSLGWITGSGSGTVPLGAAGATTVQRTAAIPSGTCGGTIDRVTFTYFATDTR